MNQSTTCSIADCTGKIKGHGYCSKHWQRYRTHGDPLGGARERARTTAAPYRPKGLTIEESFRWFMPDAPPAAGVQWLWTGPQDDNGYGCFSHKGKRIFAHRISYELFVGPIPEGLIVRHKNDIPLDVNPYNLETGTLIDNRNDCVARERLARGADQHLAKLTDEAVSDMRRLYRTGKFTYADLAVEYGVSESAAKKAIRRETWKHVDPIRPVRLRPAATNLAPSQPTASSRKRKGPRGEAQGSSKLTSGVVGEIIAQYRAGGVTQQQLAERYGVNQSAISKIVNGQRWSY